MTNLFALTCFKFIKFEEIDFGRLLKIKLSSVSRSHVYQQLILHIVCWSWNLFDFVFMMNIFYFLGYYPSDPYAIFRIVIFCIFGQFCIEPIFSQHHYIIHKLLSLICYTCGKKQRKRMQSKQLFTAISDVELTFVYAVT